MRDPKVEQTVGALYKRAWDEQVAPRYRSDEPAPGTSRERFERMLAAAEHLANHIHEAPVWIGYCASAGCRRPRPAPSWSVFERRTVITTPAFDRLRSPRVIATSPERASGRRARTSARRVMAGGISRPHIADPGKSTQFSRRSRRHDSRIADQMQVRIGSGRMAERRGPVEYPRPDHGELGHSRLHQQ